MPTDQLSRHIADAVRTLRKAYPRQITVKNGHRVRESLEDYFAQTLYPQLCHRFPSYTDGVVPGVVGLMVYLGPEEEGFPPSSLHDELIGHAVNYAGALPGQKRLKRLVELTLAYGCRWKRSTMSSLPRWDGHWPGAVQELTEAAYHFVLQTEMILADTVRRFPLNWGVQRAYADMITAEFTGRKLESAGVRYKQYQMIHEWDPKVGNLYGQLKRAIRGGGSQKGRLQPNWFKTGLLFKLLKDDGRLDVGKVAFQQCRQCSYEAEYNGGICAKCNKAAFIFYKTLLIVPGVYVGAQFWHCPWHVYDWQQTPSCLYCKASRTRKPAWRCYCRKQRSWLDDTPFCPNCGMEKPKEIKWTCQNHYYQFNLSQCPDCKASPPERHTTLLVL